MIDYINISFMPMNNEKLNNIWIYFYLSYICLMKAGNRNGKSDCFRKITL